MDLSRVIVGIIATEKSERLKAADRTYTIRVAPDATKVDVRNALLRYYDIQATSVRSLRNPSKKRLVGRGKVMVKRKPYKKMMVTISQKSTPLDITNFKV